MNRALRHHIIFWSLLLISITLIQFFKDGNSQPLLEILVQNTKRLPAMFIAAYTFNEVLLPKFYSTRKYILFGVTMLMLFYFASALDRFINVHVYEPMFREGNFEQESVLQILSDPHFLFMSYVPPLIIATMAMTFERVLQEKRQVERKNLQLERDKNLAELHALKSQLHPHFLFNTLNNIYALAVQKSDKTPETVARLSSMLDYILYQCHGKLVLLEKEVGLLENYIALERLRYGEEITITFTKAYSENLQIMPLILLSIVENAFKHGASGSLEMPEIHITLSQEAETIFFLVRNTKNRTKQLDETGYSKGIGVHNITQQLELLYWDFSYEVTDEGDWYQVLLRINTQQIND